MPRELLPNRRPHVLYSMFYSNIELHVGIGFYDQEEQRPAEIFIDPLKTEGSLTANARDAAVAASFALQFGASLRVMHDGLNKVTHEYTSGAAPRSDAAGLLGAALDCLKEHRPDLFKEDATGATEYCHPAPGEPSFILLGRDPQAPGLIELWADVRDRLEPDSKKPLRAREIAEKMRLFKDANPEMGMPRKNDMIGIKQIENLNWAVEMIEKLVKHPNICLCELSGELEVITGPYPGSCELCEKGQALPDKDRLIEGMKIELDLAKQNDEHLRTQIKAVADKVQADYQETKIDRSLFRPWDKQEAEHLFEIIGALDDLAEIFSAEAAEASMTGEMETYGHRDAAVHKVLNDARNSIMKELSHGVSKDFWPHYQPARPGLLTVDRDRLQSLRLENQNLHDQIAAQADEIQQLKDYISLKDVHAVVIPEGPISFRDPQGQLTFLNIEDLIPGCIIKRDSSSLFDSLSVTGLMLNSSSEPLTVERNFTFHDMAACLSQPDRGCGTISRCQRLGCGFETGRKIETEDTWDSTKVGR